MGSGESMGKEAGIEIKKVKLEMLREKTLKSKQKLVLLETKCMLDCSTLQ